MASIQSSTFSSPIDSQVHAPEIAPMDSVYDAVPYGSYPIASSHPDKLFAVAKLFGMNPVLPERARILELGCAGGGNLIPIASQFPNAVCHGVELSAAQCEAANVAIQYVGLSNIKIQQGSIADITSDLGKFDYILCHGVFSWVPEFVREAILRVASENLSENGVAYISYNTFPGWYQRGMVRDMMLRHVSGITDPVAKIAQARALLNFLAKSSATHTTPYAAYLRSEAEFLEKQPDLYLFHDHLEEHNKPYFFQDFVKFASHYGLQFLGESSLSSMWAGNLGAETSKKLGDVSDAVVSGHYMDCIVGRSFRETLLVHNGVPISRNLDSSRFGDIRFLGSFQVEPAKTSEGSDLGTGFKTKNGQTIYSNDKPTQLAFAALNNAFPGSLSIEQVCHAMEAGIDATSPVTIDKQRTVATLMQWVLTGYIDLRFQPDRMAVAGTKKPKAARWARSQARAGRYVTNLRHDFIALNDVDRHILILMDGNRDVKQIAIEIGGMIASGAIKVENPDAVVGKKARELPLRIAEQAIAGFAKLALLMPE